VKVAWAALPSGFQGASLLRKVSAHHSEGSPFRELMVRDTVRIRVRVSHLVVAISRTFPCNDYE